MYIARLRLYTRWFTCSVSAHAQGDKSTLSALRPFYWSTILSSFCLSLPFSPLSLCPATRPVSFLQSRSLALSTPLFYLSLSIALARTRENAHQLSLSLYALVSHLRHSDATEWKHSLSSQWCNIRTNIHACARVKYVRMKRTWQ